VTEESGGAGKTLGRRERRKREVHERILGAAVALFDAHGVEETKVDDICARADVAQKTFFNHFPSKRHLFGEIAEAFTENLCILVEEARKQPVPTPQRLTHLFRRAAEEARRHGPRHRELLLEVVRMANAEDLDPTPSRGLAGAFRRLLEDGVAAGDVTREHGVGFLTEMVLAPFLGVMLSWAREEDYPLDEHLEEAARFLSHAIAKRERGRSLRSCVVGG